MGGVPPWLLTSTTTTRCLSCESVVNLLRGAWVQCVVVEPVSEPAFAATGPLADDDEDVAMIGVRGPLPLSDFAHARFACVNHKFNMGRNNMR